MKPFGEKEFDRVLRMFKVVHREKEKRQIGDGWQAGAMRLVRNNAPVCQPAEFFEIFQQFVWKLAPVSCVLVLLLGFLVSQTNFLSDYELAKIFLSDPSDLSFISLYNG